MSETLELYDYWRSSAAYRVRIGLNLKGLGYASHPVNLAPGASEQLSEAYRAVNPQQRVPTLVTGAGALGQSLAILEWLDETCPEPPLLPADPWLRAEARAFALSIACEIHPMGNLSVLRQLGQQFGAGEGELQAWRERWFGAGMAALEAQLAARPASTYAFGDTPCLADICLVPQAYNCRRFGIDLSPYPRLCAVTAAAEAHPAFAAAAPERQPDAPSLK
ncbi:maleylacetoacetate isomerase [Phenylobacterium montanum]|uniref:Maleylacetoacetate isomerase n=1 Tax=Phenylobacterium montanum TaxID=2823693 RepID=A0A975G3G8_9CAUL|nr:maleylacetoacetate isomerase [Caulobacter sp. S6]QUD90109.1 maleylacetoacetate isomerase [Caulobacter sp. S6]